MGKIKELIKSARLQAMISLGDEDLFELLFRHYEEGGTFGALNKVENSLDYSFDDYLKKIRGCYIPWKLK